MLFGEAGAHFCTGSFEAGLALVEASGKQADAANRYPSTCGSMV